MHYVCTTMGKTQFVRLTQALTKTFFFNMLIGTSIMAQELQIEDGFFKDPTGFLTPVITGGTVVDDVLILGNTAGNMIRIPDNGKVSFEGGFTVKAQLYFEQPPAYGFVFKFGSMSLDFINGKLTQSWMSFPSEPIYTTTGSQFTYFPVGTELLNGYSQMPLNEWVDIEVNYDEAIGLTTTKINGVVDRTLLRYRGPERIKNTSNQSIRFLENGKNVRVRSFSFTPGPPEQRTVKMNAYVNGLPFKKQIQITLDQIDNRLPLPISFTVYLQRPGQLTQSFAMRLNSYDRKDTLIPMPAWSGKSMNVKIKNSWFEEDFEITNRTAADPYTTKYPIFMYHAQPEDFRQLSGMGFNVIQNDFNVMSSGLPTAEIKQALDSAQANGMSVIVVANSGGIKLDYVSQFKSHKALYGWYLADEPVGAFLHDTVRNFNNAVKRVDEKRPTMVMMNNFNRLMGLDCDIIGVDPFPVPNISMRMVDDAVNAGRRACNDTKPVWCLIPHFTGKVPTVDELKSMAWIGIIAGAAGIGVFEYDHRSPGTPNGYYAGSNATHVANLGTVFKEVRSWDWLLNAKAIGYTTGNIAIHACTKTASGKTYLLVANDSRKVETAVFNVGNKMASLVMNPLEVRMINVSTLPPALPIRKATQAADLTGSLNSGQWISYRIQFTNESYQDGTPATVSDKLDSRLDVSTLTMGESSHGYTLEIGKDNHIAMKLDALQLPSANGPRTMRDAFIDFKIKPLAGTRAGTTIHNQYQIQFGEEQPLQSPTHTIVLSADVEAEEKKGIQAVLETVEMSAHPNPGSGQLQVSTSKAGILEMYDLAGRKTVFDLVEGRNEISTADLTSGLYILRHHGQNMRWIKL